jgi:hypothetical protein
VISNCVVNLSADKLAVLNGVRRLLKRGGEFFFADVYADRRVPEALRHDPVLYGECLSGALYWNDFLRLARQAGFADPRLVSDRPLAITDPELAARTGAIRFFSATYRLFSIPELEDACEDHGQAVIYRGTIPNIPTPCPSTSTTGSRPARCFRCAATRSGCWPRAAWRRILRSSAISAATTGCSRAAARPSPLRAPPWRTAPQRRPPPAQAAVPVAEASPCQPRLPPLSSRHCC